MFGYCLCLDEHTIYALYDKIINFHPKQNFHPRKCVVPKNRKTRTVEVQSVCNLESHQIRPCSYHLAIQELCLHKLIWTGIQADRDTCLKAVPLKIPLGQSIYIIDNILSINQWNFPSSFTLKSANNI